MRLSQYLQSRKTVSVAGLGGSITQGAGSTDGINGYLPQLVGLLGKAYPDTAFQEINAGLGGTGSLTGYLRITRDVLEKSPDLLLIEFIVNDENDADTAIYTENIIRCARRHSPTLPIILFFATDNSLDALYGAGEVPMAVREQMRVAEHYGIPTVNAGPLIREKLASGEKWERYFSDGCHPSDAGHRLYAELLCQQIRAADCPILTPEPLTDRLFSDPAPCTPELSQNDWILRREPLILPLIPSYYYTEKAGAKIACRFTGDTVAAYYSIAKDNNDLRFRIDGGTWYPFRPFDRFALDFCRPALAFFTLCMPREEWPAPGEHLIEVEMLPEKAEEADGGCIRIGPFFAADLQWRKRNPGK